MSNLRFLKYVSMIETIIFKALFLILFMCQLITLFAVKLIIMYLWYDVINFINGKFYATLNIAKFTNNV